MVRGWKNTSSANMVRNSFELSQVSDMAAETAFNEVVTGVLLNFPRALTYCELQIAAGFVHVANDMTHSMDPELLHNEA
jgi:hypothetical protein